MDEWTPEQVEEFLIEAAYTNEAMPDPERRFLNESKSSMPEYRGEKNDEPELNQLRHIPSPAAISRYLSVLEWLQIIPRIPERKLMYYAFAVQLGTKQYRIPWRKAKYAVNLDWSNEWCRKIYRAWLVTIANRINSGEIVFS